MWAMYSVLPGVDKFLTIASGGLLGVMKIDEAVKFVHNYDQDDICKIGDVCHTGSVNVGLFVSVGLHNDPVYSFRLHLGM